MSVSFLPRLLAPCHLTGLGQRVIKAVDGLNRRRGEGPASWPRHQTRRTIELALWALPPLGRCGFVSLTFRKNPVFGTWCFSAPLSACGPCDGEAPGATPGEQLVAQLNEAGNKTGC